MSKWSTRAKITILLNIVLLLGMSFALVMYLQSQSATSMSVNTNAIEQNAVGKADFLSIYLKTQKSTVENFTSFVQSNYQTIDKVISFFTGFSYNEQLCLQLINTRTFTGVSFSAGILDTVDYTDSSYVKMWNMVLSTEKASNTFSNDEETPNITGCTPEFTNPIDGQRSVAFYKTFTIQDENGESSLYVLFQIIKIKQLLQKVLNISSYAKSSAVLVDFAGNYVLKQGEFRSDNIYSYFDLYNNPSVKEKELYQNEVHKLKHGSLVFNNSNGESSIYAFSEVPDIDNLYYFVGVPIDSFNSAFTSIILSIILVAFLLFLITIDLLYLNSVNHKLKESLRQAEIANNAKTDFLSHMSHDMRTPMNGIIGMTTLTLAQDDLSDETRNNLQTIKDSSTFLLGLINDTLDMSKIESKKMQLNPRSVSVSELFNTVLSSNKVNAEAKGILFEVQFGSIDTSTCILVDPVRIVQIFMNILSNAIKFTPPEGKITIAFKELERKGNSVHALITITDTGIGISKEFQKKIFEPFEQEYNEATATVSGTGLGLTIVKSLVELMNGTISIESEKNRGTAISIEMSFTIVDPPNKKYASTDAVEMDVFSNKNILLVEDNSLNMKIAKKILESKKLNITCATNGLQAVQVFTDAPPHKFDCILMDIRMPVMDGLAATRAIRQLNREDAKQIPIIAMTANAFDDDIEASMQAGMDEHLAKPVEPEKIFATLATYLK